MRQFKWETVTGFSNSWGYVTLFNKLLENGNWTVNDLKDLASNNFMRVLRKVEEVGTAVKNNYSKKLCAIYQARNVVCS